MPESQHGRMSARALVAFGALLLTFMVGTACGRVGDASGQSASGAERSPNIATLKTVSVPVEGMICVACAASVKTTLKDVDGVRAVEVNLERRAARIEYDPAKVDVAHLTKTINELGYKAGTPISPEAR